MCVSVNACLGGRGSFGAGVLVVSTKVLLLLLRRVVVVAGVRVGVDVRLDVDGVHRVVLLPVGCVVHRFVVTHHVVFSSEKDTHSTNTYMIDVCDLEIRCIYKESVAQTGKGRTLMVYLCSCGCSAFAKFIASRLRVMSFIALEKLVTTCVYRAV